MAPDELRATVEEYVGERVAPHPILGKCLPSASIGAMGWSVEWWDERSDLDLRFVLGDQGHAALKAGLQEAHLWEAGRDPWVRIVDREPVRRFPGARLAFLSASDLAQQLRFDLPTALWAYSHCLVMQDPEGLLGGALTEARERFGAALPELRREHYYRFRAARNEIAAAVQPRR